MVGIDMKKICLLCFVIALFVCQSAFAAPFASKSNGPTIMVGEVYCYGQYNLSKFVDSLRDRIDDGMRQADKFNVVAGTPDTELMHKIHKNAIVMGHFYNRGVSGVELIKYANQVLGKNYRPTDEECKQKAKEGGTPYSLSPDIAALAKEYAERENIDYLVFANINYAEVWLRNSIFNTNVPDEYRGKSVRTNVEYYLVNARTGKVYDGLTIEKTTAQQINMFIASYGKGMDMGIITSGIMDKHVKVIIKKLASEGLKRI